MLRLPVAAWVDVLYEQSRYGNDVYIANKLLGGRYNMRCLAYK